MKVVSFLNMKGGVAKTVSSTTFAYLLNKAGYKTLLVDADPQCNSSAMYEVPSEEQYDQGEIFLKQYDSKPVIWTSKSGVDVLKGGKLLSDINYQIYDENKTENTEMLLRERLRALPYDYIVIDNSPSRNYISRMSLCASDLILAPIDVDSFSFEGLQELLDEIQTVNGKYGLNISFKVFFTKANMRTSLYKSLSDQYSEIFESIFCKCTIRQDNTVKEACTVLKPLPRYNKKSKTIRDYILLMSETLQLPKGRVARLMEEYAT